MGIRTNHDAGEAGEGQVGEDELARRRAGVATTRRRARRELEEPEAADEEAVPPEEEEAAGAVLTIDCGTCELRHTSACRDCLVSFVCDRPAGGAVVLHAAEARAVRLLGTGGLVPELRHRRRTG